MPADDDIAELLSSMGLTTIEARAYVHLLRHSPTTGYRIAKAIGRSFTQTYKALSALESKGAVLTSEGKKSLYRAVPLEELLDQIENRFRTQRRAALELARELPRSPSDLGFYQLGTEDQVYERARKMLAASRERVYAELFHEPLEVLGPSLEETALRGVDVTTRVYQPTRLERVRVILSPYGAENLDLFPSQWLAVFVDGIEFLLAHLIPGGGIYQAVWSANLFIAHVFFDYVTSDFRHYAFRPVLEKAKTVTEIRKGFAAVERAFPLRADLGFQQFLHHIRRQEEEGDD